MMREDGVKGDDVDSVRCLTNHMYVEPTSAAAAAGLRQLLKAGTIVPSEMTVLVLTGSGLKASEKIGQLLNVGARGE